MIIMMMLTEITTTTGYNHTRHESPSSEKFELSGTYNVKKLSNNFPRIVDYA
jgi:hypothetical protein